MRPLVQSDVDSLLRERLSHLERGEKRYQSKVAQKMIKLFQASYRQILALGEQADTADVATKLSNLSDTIKNEKFFFGQAKLLRYLKKDLERLSHFYPLDSEVLKAPEQVGVFNKEFDRVKQSFKNYREQFAWYSIIGLIRSIQLWFFTRRLIRITAAVENDEAKAKVLHSAIKSYVASRDQDGLSGISEMIVKDCMGYENNDDYYKAKIPTPNSSHAKFLEAEKNKDGIDKYPKIGVKLMLTFSDITLKRLVDQDLYSHFELKNLYGSPADRNYKKLPDGWYMYVVMPDHKIRFIPTAPDEEKKYNGKYRKIRSHSQMTGDGEVITGGMFCVSNGLITELDADSGHYASNSMKYVEYAAQHFETLGIDTSQMKKVERIRPRGHKYFRATRKMKVMFWALFLPGEKAEDRPDPIETNQQFSSKIPDYY